MKAAQFHRRVGTLARDDATAKYRRTLWVVQLKGIKRLESDSADELEASLPSCSILDVEVVFSKDREHG